MTIRQHDTARRDAAFTLIELLIAVVVFSLVLAAINGVFYGAVHMRNKAAAAIEQTLPIEQTVAIIKADLRGLAAPNDTNGTLIGIVQSGITTTVGADQQGGTDFYTTTGALSDDVPFGDIQKVCYVLQNPEVQTGGGGKDLMRLVTRNLLPVSSEDPKKQFLMTGVENITFQYYDGTDWQPSWDATTMITNGLPSGIKVTIDLAADNTGGNRSTRSPIQIVVPIDSVSQTNISAAGNATTQ